MGLDSYLDKFPIVRGTINGKRQVLKPEHFYAIESWNEYKEYLQKPLREDETEKCTWKEWSGYDYIPEDEIVAEVNKHIKTHYWAWDTNHEYPHKLVCSSVGYWRKANAIHNWFVENIQDGEDDCDFHRPVTRFDLEELRDTCQEVLDSLNLKDGKIENGYTFGENYEKIYNYVDGKVATNTELAEKLLPSCDGFFFGGTGYDEYYAQDLMDTIKICDKAIEETDFNKEVLYYCASW